MPPAPSHRPHTTETPGRPTERRCSISPSRKALPAAYPACPGALSVPASEEKATNASSPSGSVSSCRLSAASTFGRRVRSRLAAVSDVSRPSSRTPAACTTPPTRTPSPASAARAAASASRSAASQATVRTSAPRSRSAAMSRAASSPGSPRPIRTSCRIPCRATRWRAASRPSQPRPPVIRTAREVSQRSSSSARSRTTLPMCRASLRWRKASGARRRSQAATGGACSAPRSKRARSSAKISWIRSGPGSRTSYVRYVTPGCAAATSAGSRRSVLPISRNRPPRGSSRSDASANSPARELSTTSTPRPPVAARKDRSKSRVREEAMWLSATPAPRRACHLAGLAVEYTSAPRWRAIWRAAVPTPPAPACTSTDSPARRSARSTRP